jgi:hypothetical protein
MAALAAPTDAEPEEAADKDKDVDAKDGDSDM